MRRLFLYFSCLIVFSNCNKTDDTKGKEVLEGRLSYYDPYTGDGIPKALGSRSVKLSRVPTDTLNFLYSVKTDADGYFVFNRINKDSTYALFFDDTIQGTKYFAFDEYKGGKTNILLQAMPDANGQNILFGQTKDNNTQPMKATICVFNSKTLFDADTCNGSIEQLITDNFGRYVQYGLLPGTYYLRAKAQVGNVLYLGTATAVVKDNGFGPADIIMSPTNYYSNGVKITVLDSYGSPVGGANVYFFNNRTLFNAEIISGSVFGLTTDNNGEKQLNNIIPGKYLLFAKAAFGSVTLMGKDSVDISNTGVSVDTVRVK